MFRPRIVVAAVALLGVATACSNTQEPSRQDNQQSTAQSPAPELQRYYQQSLDWGDCASYATTPPRAEKLFGTDGLECARLTVPLDYDEPDGETAEIGVLRRPASDEQARIGSLVSNPGGPGASGMTSTAARVSKVKSTELGERFDMVGFDPRGVGASTPRVECLTDEEKDEARLDSEVVTSEAAVERIEKANRRYAAECGERSGEKLLANVGTDSVARDMDVLRAALGDEELTYLGYSYGTRLGAEYAERFPERVRAMVLDGAMAPGNWDRAEMNLRQAAGFQQAFDSFAQWCARQRRCALGDDPDRAVERYHEITRPLIGSPASTVYDGRELSYADAEIGLVQALYSKQYWQPLNTGLSRLANGDGSVLLQLADLYHGRAEDGSYSNMMAVYTAVTCVDADRIGGRKDYREFNRKYRRAAPFTDNGHPVSSARDACAFWPVPETGDKPEPRPEKLPETLVISTTGDPATPHENGRRLADALGGGLLTYEGEGHTVFLHGNDCVNEAGTRYLVELKVPEQGKRCSA
ncbi:alpha/beta hydrolase [Actinopolyspora erythraea]|uniref:Hydrolase n=1 Tax=Actinopolyspora erythraea TaxID=414996 RepID=A0A099D1X1_9ACTN|nr:alpha/beta hydrolase [Actinopolyspora erythraea]ASU78054.1 alpha/beta hydrolase [Actinopolyspora erythraea]KGI79822.1 hydrolase [Actinopolyspora erythraea]